ncbi:hypothetical protein [Chitinilyticum piscinae]|uniref:Uncharacterized protein n=1 Tax=Chitinilyticum piscinae TaxID=2866724 RepID=A0A8J7FHA3_9NEIS|nr:hypothetical protein [Chitinilyticum piscinae]MBE9609175.1 hypothetical protein [Chitinilyticum piscinae]
MISLNVLGHCLKKAALFALTSSAIFIAFNEAMLAIAWNGERPHYPAFALSMLIFSLIWQILLAKRKPS